MIINRFIQFWKDKEIEFTPGAIEAEISNFENQYQVKLPTSFRDLYLLTNGISYDHDLIHFWPISELAPVPTVLSKYGGSPDYRGIENSLPEASKHFVFADYSIMIHVYAVLLNSELNNPAPVVCIANGQMWKYLSPSFESFLYFYLENYDSILLPWKF